MKTFEMTDLGLMNYFLDIEVKQQEDNIFISQTKYIEALLKKFKMYDCKLVATPLVVNEKLQKDDGAQETDASRYKSLIGSLLSHSHKTRHYVCYKSSIKIHAKAKSDSLWSREKNFKISTRYKGVWNMLENHD